MSEVNKSTEVQEIARNAGSQFTSGIGFVAEDARLGLKYMLLRLSLLGLSDEEQKKLFKLGQLAFQGADLRTAADEIKSDTSASPLAVAIADIVSTFSIASSDL